jgi:hypothetical protein
MRNFFLASTRDIPERAASQSWAQPTVLMKLKHEVNNKHRGSVSQLSLIQKILSPECINASSCSIWPVIIKWLYAIKQAN